MLSKYILQDKSVQQIMQMLKNVHFDKHTYYIEGGSKDQSAESQNKQLHYH